MFKRIIIIGIIGLIVVQELYSQHYNVVKIGVREGLLHSLVTDVTQDKRGDVWMSTGGGLCRYNGVEFEYLTTKNGLNFTRLTCVAIDDDDNVWVGSSKGLNLILGKSILSVKDSLLGNEIITISSAGHSMVWVVSNTGLYKVIYLNDKFIVSKALIPIFKSSALTQIFQDRILSNFIFQTKSGNAYYGNSGVLFCIFENKVEKINIENNIYVNTGVEINDSLVLFGTNNGLYRLNGVNIIPFNHINTSNINIKDIKFDGSKLWFLGKEKNGEVQETFLYVIDFNDSTRIQRIGKSNGFIDEPTQINIDHEGNLWTTSNNGVSLLKSNTFISYSTKDGLVGNKIWGLFKAKDTALWVGTIGEGLSIKKANKYLNYTVKNGLPDNYIGKIYQTKKGDIYLGTNNTGLCKAIYNKKVDTYSFTRLPLLKELSLRVDDIVEDKQGVLWIASSKGIFYSLNKKSFIRLPLFQNDTGQVFVQRLLIDSLRNTLWIGTRYNGIYTMRDNVIRKFNLIDSKEEISSLAIDNIGDIWFGTRNNGAYRYNGVNIKNISENDGLASNLVYILYPDKHNNLWVGTNLGLDRIDLMSFKGGGVPSIRHYGSDDGLIDLETNLNGVIEDDYNGFWIATNGGLLKYNRSEDKINSIPPKVRILNLKLNSQDTDWCKFSEQVNRWNGLPDNLTLSYSQNHLTFEFIGVSFRNPRMVKYAWKLDGFDDQWIVSYSRQAIYSNLPPGNYIFKLKASNSDLVWSDEVYSMSFTVKPPFWKTWWFRVAVIILLALLIYVYILSRIRSLREKQKELEALVDVRTIELREQFEIVEDKNKQILDSLKYAKFLQGAILASVDEIKSNFSDVFIYYRPKDFVSGDFYWYSRYNDVSIFAVADCTGHGVPGAIISVICENALRQAVTACHYENPAQILQQTNQYVIETFSQTNKDIHDGMEIALFSFNHKTFDLTFSGAKLGLYLIVDGEFLKLKPSIQRIGWNKSTISFTNQGLKLEKGNLLYMFTDGFGDQFDFKSKEKYTSARLRKLLHQNSFLSLTDLHDIVDNEFETWRGDNDQIDDVLVVGIKL